MVHDMIEVEKMGKPAVPIISGRFEGDAEASARTFAMPALRFVIVPRIYRNLTPAESLRNTEPAIDDIVRSLTGNGESAVSQNRSRKRTSSASRAATGSTRCCA